MIRRKKADPTLLDVFKQGDRVVQVIYSEGNKKEYSGIVMKIQKHCMAIYWDNIDGRPVSNLQEVFTVFHESEVFYGNKDSSPITKEDE